MQSTFDNWYGDALAHYGVLGMKWGVRKDPKRAYEKAMAKKNKLDMRAAKGNLKAAKYQKKAAKTELRYQKSKYMAEGSGKQIRINRGYLDQLAAMGKDNNEPGTASRTYRQDLAYYQKKLTKYERRMGKQQTKLNNLKTKQAKASLRDAKAQTKAAKWANAMLKTFGSLEYSEVEKRFGKAS